MIWRNRVIDPIRRNEVVHRIGSGLLPLLNDISGIRTAFLVTPGDTDVVCVAMCDEPDTAHAATAVTTQWINWNVAVLLTGEETVALGDVFH